MIETDILTKEICWDKDEDGFSWEFKNDMIEIEITNFDGRKPCIS